MTFEELGQQIYKVSHITGEFLLRSGKTSTEYFDKYKFETDPVLLDAICGKMAELIPEGTEVLAGLETGGIPVATILSQKTGLPAIFVRKVAKEYGTGKLAEGTGFAGKNVLIIEDVVTTGGQIIKSTLELRDLGANIHSVLCVIVREQKAFENLSAEELELKPLYTMEQLKNLAE